MIDTFLDFKNINKSFRDKNEKIIVLENVNISLPDNKLISLTGPSGSGKSTLIHLLCLLDTPNSGIFKLYKSNNLFEMNENEKSSYRKKNISIIFQNFNLISDLTAL